MEGAKEGIFRQGHSLYNDHKSGKHFVLSGTGRKLVGQHKVSRSRRGRDVREQCKGQS